MTDTSVKYFDSTMSGAPSLSGTAGALIGELDACLLDGFGSMTLNSLVVASNVATATYSSGHGFAMIGNTGPVITIAGATPSGLNGQWRVTVTSTTQFTFATSGISDQTASGTITAKRAPAGWEKRYSGTNKAAYARLNLQATPMLLKINDSPAQYPTLIMYESMSDVDTGSGLAPTSGTFYTAKSETANTTARAWRIFADDRSLYLFVKADGTNWDSGLAFGDLISYKSGIDIYHAFLIAHSSESTKYFYLYEIGASTASLLSRSYSQIGGAVALRRYAHPLNTYLGRGGASYPSPAMEGFHGWPVEAWENADVPRGLMPGLYSPVHANGTINDMTSISGVPQIDGGELLVVAVSSTPRAAFVLDRPWQ